MSIDLQTATLAGGCFWCIEAAFSQLDGVEKVVSGYMGGSADTANYKTVCKGTTEHAEVIQLVFNTEKISYREILEIFFTLHDPTQLNRQGNDIGPQYRSAIFTHNSVQAKAATDIITEMAQENVWSDPIVTKVTPAIVFFSGEITHQGYFNANPDNQYCQAIISPKLAKFKHTFASKLK